MTTLNGPSGDNGFDHSLSTIGARAHFSIKNRIRRLSFFLVEGDHMFQKSDYEISFIFVCIFDE